MKNLLKLNKILICTIIVGLTPLYSSANPTDNSGGTPAEVTAEQPPAEVTAEQPPAEVTAEQTPAEVTAEQTPAEVTAEQTPAEVTAEQTPAEVTAEQPPAEVTAEQPPAEVTAEQTPAEDCNKDPVEDTAKPVADAIAPLQAVANNVTSAQDETTKAELEELKKKLAAQAKLIKTLEEAKAASKDSNDPGTTAQPINQSNMFALVQTMMAQQQAMQTQMMSMMMMMMDRNRQLQPQGSFVTPYVSEADKMARLFADNGLRTPGARGYNPYAYELPPRHDYYGYGRYDRGFNDHHPHSHYHAPAHGNHPAAYSPEAYRGYPPANNGYPAYNRYDGRMEESRRRATPNLNGKGPFMPYQFSANKQASPATPAS